MVEDLGARIRQARHAAGLTMAEVAARSGFTPGYISQVERGLTNPSLGALYRICDAVGTRTSALFFGDELAAKQREPVRAHFGVVRHDQRRVLIPPGADYRHEIICPDVQHAMEGLFTYAAPGVDSGQTPLTHPGEEMVIVVTGKVEYFLDEVPYLLEGGDVLYFEASIPHRWRNAGDDELQMIGVNAPPHM
jgi:transcriptional regulator with XRE-family HTH domain